MLILIPKLIFNIFNNRSFKRVYYRRVQLIGIGEYFYNKYKLVGRFLIINIFRRLIFTRNSHPNSVYPLTSTADNTTEEIYISPLHTKYTISLLSISDTPPPEKNENL